MPTIDEQNKEVLSKSHEQGNKTRYQPPILVILEVGETESGSGGSRERSSSVPSWAYEEIS